MKNAKKVSALILAFFVSCILFAISSNNVYAWSGSTEEQVSADHKVYSKATLDDNFADDTVVIELNREESFKFKNYTFADFPEVHLSSIEDVNNNATRIIQEQITAENMGKSSAIDRLIDNESYRRIITLKLVEPGKRKVLEAIRLLEKRDDIISASPDYIYYFRALPNDQSFTDSSFIATHGTQWGLNGITWNIGASEAWDITTGSSEVIVGIIDTGIRATHQDLVNRVDVGLSRDFTQGNPVGHNPVDTNGHGTMVAGIVGAEGNNNLGITGVAQNITLVQLRVSMSYAGVGAVQIADAIDYATGTFTTSRPISILNFSGGSSNESTAIRQALLSYPGLFVSAADNANLDHDTSLDYPTEYSRDPSFTRNNIISVSSLNSLGTKPTLAAFGQTSVTIFAPGEDILSTRSTSNTAYIRGSGTSFATPHVVGVAALMLSVNPNLSPSQIKQILINTATSFPALSTLCVAGGRLNALAAVQDVPLPHSHSYDVTWINYRQHRSICSCGDKTSLVGHAVSINDNGFPYKTCLVCGGPAEMGFVGFDNLPNMFESLSSIYIREYFGNDSFILSNGVIVLSDIDLEAYYEGTLILPDSYDSSNHHSHDCEACYSACIDCDSSCYDCDDYNVMYTYNDRRKTLYVHLNRREQDFFNN